MKYILVAFLLVPFCLPAQNSKQLKEKALQENTAAKWNDVAEYFYHQRTDPKSLKDCDTISTFDYLHDSLYRQHFNHATENRYYKEFTLF